MTVLTPVIALCRTVATDVSYHVEAGIGIRVLSHMRIDEPELSTAFHFGELAGSACTSPTLGSMASGPGSSTFPMTASRIRTFGATFGEVRTAYGWE